MVILKARETGQETNEIKILLAIVIPLQYCKGNPYYLACDDEDNATDDSFFYGEDFLKDILLNTPTYLQKKPRKKYQTQKNLFPSNIYEINCPQIVHYKTISFFS